MKTIRRVFSMTRKSDSGASGTTGSTNGMKSVCGETSSTAPSSKKSPTNKYSTNTESSSSEPAPPPLHVKCRNAAYPQSDRVSRFTVPESSVPWDVEFADYKPVEYSAPVVLGGPVWADPALGPAFTPRWNDKDGKINRKSFVKKYEIGADGRPLNPVGRTGIVGRGLLGKWGPNHAADPIVTRWKRDDQGATMSNAISGKPILQFVSIQRKDSGEWAIPGGMVDDDEEVSLALKREFGEEALNSIQVTEAQRKGIEIQLKKFFENGTEIYKGYVDDPRNTDNAWMETVAVNFHDDSGMSVGQFPLSAGDDAGDVQWRDVDVSLKLYASHASFVESAAKLLNAHWN